MHTLRSVPALIVAAFCISVSSLAPAQVTTCKTSNCEVGNPGNPVLPAACTIPGGAERIASPRILEVFMDSTTLRFSPGSTNTNATANPIKIEGRHSTAGQPWDYQCIIWHKVGSTAPPWHSATENTLGSTCNTAVACTSTNVTPDPCAYETGNINHATGGTPPNLEYGTCHYRDIAPASYSMTCRLHTAGGMNGQLIVVPPIGLTLTKQPAGQVRLDWVGGSAAGPWDVLRDATPGTAQKMSSATTTKLSAVAGATLRTITDGTCSPTPGNLCAYMIRECNRRRDSANCI